MAMASDVGAFLMFPFAWILIIEQSEVA